MVETLLKEDVQRRRQARTLPNCLHVFTGTDFLPH
jgi:hypothetical protein